MPTMRPVLGLWDEPANSRKISIQLVQRKWGIDNSTSKGWNKYSHQVTLICIISFTRLMITRTTIQIISSETAIRSTVKIVKCNGIKYMLKFEKYLIHLNSNNFLSKDFIDNMTYGHAR